MPQENESQTITINDALLEKINELLQQTAQKVARTTPNVFDYFSFIELMLLLEAKTELARLQEWIKTPDSFVENFRNACTERHNDSSKSFSFTTYPDSLCNILYREIAKLVFPDDPLAILVPGLNEFYRVKFSRNFTLDSDVDEGTKPTIGGKLAKHTPRLLAIKREQIDIDSFSTYAVAGSKLFVVSSLQQLTLIPLQANFYNHLNRVFPELAQRVYSHNAALKTLKEKIDAYNNPRTPILALRQLIKGLKFGGAGMTGEVSASIDAQRAYFRFRDYLESLPTAIRTPLEGMKISNSDNQSLSSVMSNLRQGECVEIAAMALADIVEYNQHLRILNSDPQGTKVTVRQQRQFVAEILSLDTHRNFFGINSLPQELLSKAMQLSPIGIELLLNMLCNLPASEYAKIFANVPNNLSLARILLSILAKKSFSEEPEKVRAILSWLVPFETSAGTNLEEFFTSIVFFRCPELFTDVLQRYKDECTAYFSNPDTLTDFILRFISQPQHLKTLFLSLPKQKRVQLLIEFHSDLWKELNSLAAVIEGCALQPQELKTFLETRIEADGATIWQRARMKSSQFCNLIQAIPAALRWQIIKEQNTGECVPQWFYEAHWQGDEIAALLDLFSEKEKEEIIAALLRVDKPQLLTKTSSSLPLFKIFHRHLTKEECQNAVANNLIKNNEPIWRLMAKDEGLVHEFIQKFAPTELWAVFQLLKSEGNSFLHQLGKENSHVLVDVLELLPEKDQAAALLWEEWNSRVIGYAVNDPRFVRKFFFSKNHEERKNYFELKHNNQTLLLAMLNNPATLSELLYLVPKSAKGTLEDRLQFLLSKEHGVSPLINLITLTPAILTVLQDFFSDNNSMQRLINSPSDIGRNLLFNTNNKLEVIVALKPYISLETLKNQDVEGNTLFHCNRFLTLPMLKELLNGFEPGVRKELFLITNKNNDTSFEAAAKNNPDNFIHYLGFIPEMERHAVIDSLPNLWDLITRSKSLISVLKHLPISQRSQHLRKNPKLFKNLRYTDFVALFNLVDKNDLSYFFQQAIKKGGYNIFLLSLNSELEFQLDNIYNKWRSENRNTESQFEVGSLQSFYGALGCECPEAKMQILVHTIRLFRVQLIDLSKEQKAKVLQDYQNSLDAVPKISRRTRNACIALAMTVIGIIPALLILGIAQCGFFNERSQLKVAASEIFAKTAPKT